MIEQTEMNKTEDIRLFGSAFCHINCECEKLLQEQPQNIARIKSHTYIYWRIKLDSLTSKWLSTQ